MADDTYKIKVDVDLSKPNRETDKFTKKVDKATKETEGLTKSWKSFSVAAAGVVAGVGLLSAGITKAVNEARKIETMTAKFVTLTGSVEMATKLVKDLTDFTSRTPFQLEGVSSAAKTLLAFGSSVDEVKPLLQDLGDISAAVGAPMEDLALIFGQVQAAGKLTGERYLQLAERGVVLNDVLADKLGVSVSQIRDEISKGNVSFKIFKEALQELNEEGQIAEGGMSKLADTLDGKLSTLGDNIDLFAGRVGSVFTPAIKAAVDALNELITPVEEKSALEKAREELKALQDQLGAGFVQQQTTGGFLGFQVTEFDREGVQQRIDLKMEEIAELERAQEEADEKEKQRVRKLNAQKMAAEKKEQNSAASRLKAWNSFKLTEEQQLQQKKATIVAQGIGAIAAVAKEGGKESFGIWKAASLAEATIAGYLAIQKALASSPPPFNFIAASAVGALTALQIRGIAQTKPPAFANGGIVGGNSFTGDNVTAQVNSGEMVLNRQQQATLFQQANNGGGSDGLMSAIDRLGERISNLEIVMRADDIEIARSVNRAINDGFVLAKS